MLFIYLLSETFFSSRGKPWCFMITIPQIFTQDRRLEVARGFPDPLTHQMFYFWKTPITQWQLITRVSNSTVLPQVSPMKFGQPDRGGLTWKLHTPLAGTAVFDKTPGVNRRPVPKKNPLAQLALLPAVAAPFCHLWAGCSLHFLRGTPSYLE